MDGDPFESRPRRHFAIYAAAAGAALIALAAILLVAVYALNVGTLWSGAATRSQSLVIVNASGSTVRLVVREADGLIRGAGRLAPGGRATVSGSCSGTVLSAFNARAVEIATFRWSCGDRDWRIPPR
jgi:hypothetical protein